MTNTFHTTEFSAQCADCGEQVPGYYSRERGAVCHPCEMIDDSEMALVNGERPRLSWFYGEEVTRRARDPQDARDAQDGCFFPG